MSLPSASFPHLLMGALLLTGLGACSSASQPARTESSSTTAPTAVASTTTAPDALAVAAPDCANPFGLSKSGELIFQLQDASGKPLGELRQRVVSFGEEKNKKGTVTTTTVLLKSGRYDASNRLMHQQDLTFRCRQDTAFTDGQAELEFDNLRSFRDRIITDTPTPVAWPHQVQVGTTLPAGGISTDVRSSAVAIAKVFTSVQNRRVVSGPQPTTVPAGTFTCYRVEAERESVVQPKPDIIRRTTQKQVSFYCPGVGVVRTEWYDKNNKLESTQVLARRTP